MTSFVCIDPDTLQVYTVNDIPMATTGYRKIRNRWHGPDGRFVSAEIAAAATAGELPLSTARKSSASRKQSHSNAPAKSAESSAPKSRKVVRTLSTVAAESQEPKSASARKSKSSNREQESRHVSFDAHENDGEVQTPNRSNGARLYHTITYHGKGMWKDWTAQEKLDLHHYLITAKKLDPSAFTADEKLTLREINEALRASEGWPTGDVEAPENVRNMTRAGKRKPTVAQFTTKTRSE